jgi:hypothetical protein
MPPVKSTRALGLAGGLATILALSATAAVAQTDDHVVSTSATSAAAPESGALADDAGAQRGPLLPPAPAKVTLNVKNASGGTVEVNTAVKAFAKIKPFVQGELMQVRFSRGGHLIKRKNLHIRQVGHRNVGKVDLRSPKLLEPGTYHAVAVHRRSDAQEPDSSKSRGFHPKYPDLDPGNRNSKVSLFNRLLKAQGYYTSGGSKYGDGTSRAVMAFRKTNGMDRTFNATPEIFRTLAAGKGSYHLHNPGAGRHVEVDISRQVMVLADNGKPQYTFHVSTGAPSTPTIRGTYHFYRRQAGFNSVGMYYSVYFQGGYAIHGYHSVPPYNASHGCVRNPIPNSKFIYNWVSIGMPIIIYS